MATSINEFFNAVTSDSRLFLNLPVLWAVTIDGVTTSSINTTLNFAGEKWQATISPGDMTRSSGLLVAQSVTLPEERSGFDPISMGSTYMGGFLPGSALTARGNFIDRQFSINFLETQVDIEHHFFRPWLIAIGIKGLIEEGVNLKANVTVKQYSNAGQFIKGFTFRKAFPTGVEGFTLDYEDAQIKSKSVTFACENYEQL